MQVLTYWLTAAELVSGTAERPFPVEPGYYKYSATAALHSMTPNVADAFPNGVGAQFSSEGAIGVSVPEYGAPVTQGSGSLAGFTCITDPACKLRLNSTPGWAGDFTVLLTIVLHKL